jgi:hypothetical protein
LNSRNTNIKAAISSEPDHHAHGKIVFCAQGLGLRSRAGAHGFESRGERVRDGGQSFDQRNDACRCHGARAHRLDVSGPEIAGCPFARWALAGIDGVGKFLAEEINERHDHEPRKHAAGKDDARNARPDDVAHAEILACRVGVDGCALEHMLRPEVRLILGLFRPRLEKRLPFWKKV